MRTSYFARYKGADGVSIACSAPQGFGGSFFPRLAPPWGIVRAFKENSDQEAYRRAYHANVLNRLDPLEVWAGLHDKVLLCWERAGTFCHRRLVAEWLVDRLDERIPGIVVPEIVWGPGGVEEF